MNWKNSLLRISIFMAIGAISIISVELGLPFLIGGAIAVVISLLLTNIIFYLYREK